MRPSNNLENKTLSDTYWRVHLVCIEVPSHNSYDIINFEISVIFLIKSLFYMTKKLRQNFKYLENEKSFSAQIKNIFRQF